MAEDGYTPPFKVTVCVWDPQHTLERARAQERAIADGTVAKLVKEHGSGTDALRDAMMKAHLVTVLKGLDGTLYCPGCGALVDTVASSPGLKSKLDAYQDVADDFDKAVIRTRKLKARGAF